MPGVFHSFHAVRLALALVLSALLLAIFAGPLAPVAQADQFDETIEEIVQDFERHIAAASDGGVKHYVVVRAFVDSDTGEPKNISREIENALVDNIVEKFRYNRDIVVLERSRINELEKEAAFDTGGETTWDKAMFKKLGAGFLITGTTSRRSDGIKIRAKMIDILTGEILASSSGNLRWDEVDPWLVSDYRSSGSSGGPSANYSAPAPSTTTRSSSGGMGSLTVNTDPANARVRILNIKPRYLPGIQLSPGSYNIEVSSPGYQSHTEWVQVNNDDVTLSITLKKGAYPSGSSSDLASRSGSVQGSAERRYAAMLRSNNAKSQRDAAKIVYRSYTDNSALVEIVNQELLKGYLQRPNDAMHVDAMSWFTNVLGATKDKRYLSTLQQVAKGAPSSKLKDYAEKNIDEIEGTSVGDTLRKLIPW